ncbi:hypothetical protein BpHYR1_016539 [Brachionus plicatilis]|uniref:Uncharacterized protein n=1 Tax=Brachionus plicatilis TaxID=10195 RepID=A0A3M7PT74_BRAPC|nr:hypothetical protein BpHYR1_016539 [Brachionus plicatilis]
MINLKNFFFQLESYIPKQTIFSLYKFELSNDQLFVLDQQSFNRSSLIQKLIFSRQDLNNAFIKAAEWAKLHYIKIRTFLIE